MLDAVAVALAVEDTLELCDCDEVAVSEEVPVIVELTDCDDVHVCEDVLDMLGEIVKLEVPETLDVCVTLGEPVEVKECV